MSVESVTIKDTGKQVLFDTNNKCTSDSCRDVYVSTCGRYVVKLGDDGYQSETEIASYRALATLGLIEHAEAHGVSVPETLAAVDLRGNVASVQQYVHGRTVKDSGLTVSEWITHPLRVLLKALFPSNDDLNRNNIIIGPEGDVWVVDLGFDETNEEN